MKKKAKYGSCREQGVALPIVMVILVLAALVTIYTTTTSVKEQQVTADQYRSEQAFAAAQAGIDAGVERHNKFESIINPEDMPPVKLTKGSYDVEFCDIWDDPPVDSLNQVRMEEFLSETDSCRNSIDPTHPTNSTDADGFIGDRRVGVLSVGKPDDDSGRRTISVVSAPGFNFGGGPPGPPLTARGSVGVTGNITLINRYSNLTIWLGEGLDFGSAAVSTFIKPPLAADDWSREEMIYIPNSTPSCVSFEGLDEFPHPDGGDAEAASNNCVGQNSDAITGDTNLKPTLTPDEMFRRVFSRDRDSVRDMAILAGPEHYFPSVGALEAKIQELKGENPPRTLTGLVWLQSSGSVSLKDDVGSFDSPAFLVVELSDPDTDVFTITTGSTEVYGMVFVFGNANLSGGPKIYGAMMITEQMAKGAGAGTIAYDPTSLESAPAGPAGLRGIMPGTWKDWGYVR